LLVVTVTVTVVPISPAAGVYVKAKGDDPELVGDTVPAPFSVMVTDVADPPKVLPETVTGAVPHVCEIVPFNVKVGEFVQVGTKHVTLTIDVSVPVHPLPPLPTITSL
jgi:hypothetical protein